MRDVSPAECHQNIPRSQIGPSRVQSLDPHVLRKRNRCPNPIAHQKRLVRATITKSIYIYIYICIHIHTYTYT